MHVWWKSKKIQGREGIIVKTEEKEEVCVCLCLCHKMWRCVIERNNARCRPNPWIKQNNKWTKIAWTWMKKKMKPKKWNPNNLYFRSNQPSIMFSRSLRRAVSSLVTKPAPAFQAQALVNGEFKEVSLSDYKGKYVCLFFYPLDFTFVCPTEITAFNDKAPEFAENNCEVIACSVDSHFSHLAWTQVQCYSCRNGLFFWVIYRKRLFFTQKSTKNRELSVQIFRGWPPENRLWASAFTFHQIHSSTVFIPKQGWHRRYANPNAFWSRQIHRQKLRSLPGRGHRFTRYVYHWWRRRCQVSNSQRSPSWPKCWWGASNSQSFSICCWTRRSLPS